MNLQPQLGLGTPQGWEERSAQFAASTRLRSSRYRKGLAPKAKHEWLLRKALDGSRESALAIRRVDSMRSLPLVGTSAARARRIKPAPPALGAEIRSCGVCPSKRPLAVYFSNFAASSEPPVTLPAE